MTAVSIRSKRIALLLGLFTCSFALYVAAESGSQAAEVALLGALVALMFVAIWIG